MTHRRLALSVAVVVLGCSQAMPDDGKAGASVRLSTLTAGDSRCPQGGVALQTEEGTAYACNGAPGSAGPPGASGAPGAIGPPGAPGGIRAMGRGQKIWWNGFINGQATLPDATFTGTVNNTGSVLIWANVQLLGVNGSLVCMPYIGGQWAGSWSQMFTPQPIELQVETTGRNVIWSMARVYPNIPAGTHTFELRCIYTSFAGGSAALCGNTCSWGFIELPE